MPSVRFSKVLIANRGEIAVRVIAACKELGIQTVAVYSEADRYSSHVRFADQAICIGPAKSARSYLDIASIISAAEITNVDAIHPGYGFLSENAGFAEVCEASRIKFIGPRPEVIRLMGVKERARAFMREMGVPILPGSAGVLKSPEEALAVAAGIGYPVILKASAGGGGRGMRVVSRAEDLPPLFAQAQHEAGAAFSSADVYLEKFIAAPRHVEFQILGDEHGNVEILGERECTIQRRHQKLLEESPSPAVNDRQRAEIATALRRAIAAAGYSNAGTVEFLMDESGELYFIEVNARVQVEHPVTEFVTGIDIVKSQIRIAQGERLPEILQRPRRVARARHRVPHQRREPRDVRALAGPHHGLPRARRHRRARGHIRLHRLRDSAVLRFAGGQAHRLRLRSWRGHPAHAPRARYVHRGGDSHVDTAASADSRRPRFPGRPLRHEFHQEIPAGWQVRGREVATHRQKATAGATRETAAAKSGARSHSSVCPPRVLATPMPGAPGSFRNSVRFR